MNTRELSPWVRILVEFELKAEWVFFFFMVGTEVLGKYHVAPGDIDGSHQASQARTPKPALLEESLHTLQL